MTKKLRSTKVIEILCFETHEIVDQMNEVNWEYLFEVFLVLEM